MYMGVSLQPAVVFGFVRVQVVQHDMDLAVRVGLDDLIHEIQELATAAPLLVSGLD